MLVPRKMSISILESCLMARYLLPRLNTGAPGTVFPAQFYEYLPSQWGKGPSRGSRVSQILCKNLPNIHWKNNHTHTRIHAYTHTHTHTISMI